MNSTGSCSATGEAVEDAKSEADLQVDSRNYGFSRHCVHGALIASRCHACWGDNEDTPEYCTMAATVEIKGQYFVLCPDRRVDVEAVERQPGRV